ncbi:MAG TPA: cytochrome c [Xanthobacteraceae bacterium]|nr:cytochrome c [Xanthobacteraceae bacterium]
MKSLKFLGIIGLLAILGAIFAAAFFFGGFFNVAASHPDPDPVNWVLEHVRAASIARHATDQPTGSLNDPAVIQAGAKNFSQRGCVNCHGGPGVDWAKFSEGLNPGPPDLKDVVGDMLPQELFWVIKNGIKMTGMPSFGASDPPVPDPDIWSMVAFLKKLPAVSEDDYKAWTAAAPAAKP